MFCSTFCREGTTHGRILGHELPCFIFVHSFTFVFPDELQIKSNFKIMTDVNTVYERILYLAPGTDMGRCKAKLLFNKVRMEVIKYIFLSSTFQFQMNFVHFV
jgi:hypothetical protein